MQRWVPTFIFSSSFILRGVCISLLYLILCWQVGCDLIYTLLYLFITITLISNGNKYKQPQFPTPPAPMSQLCNAPLWIPRAHCVAPPRAAGLWASSSPLSSLEFHEARLWETSPAPGLPAVLMALGRRHEQEDPGDLLSAAVTRRLQPASYQAQQPGEPLVPGCTRRPGAGGKILKPATSNNIYTNLGIGE